ncbi:hypothetical protein BS17DRAFT_787739 [Gyrodon lividus]|nr:hypothetical protein BS17DRAFT_787739 [Gyrodon lividus]
MTGALQLRTVFGIVIGIVGFILLIFSFSFISRRYCGHPESMPPARLQSRTGRGNASRHRPGVQHVDYPVWRSEPVDRAPPPYEGLRLPPYTEENSGQELRSPPTARLEA